MSTHDLQHKRSRVTVSSRVDVIHGFAYAMESGDGADGEICHGHIIVNGPNETDDTEVSVLGSLVGSNFACKTNGCSECFKRVQHMFEHTLFGQLGDK